MRKRLMLGATLAVAVIGIGAGSASAATLYTTTAHTTAVPVGTTFTASTPSGAGTFNYTWTSSELWERCNNATYTFKVTKNSAGVFKAETTAGAYNACEPFALSQVGAATLEITGSSITVGTGKAWLGSKLAFGGVKLTGTPQIVEGTLTSATGNPPANGVSAQQPAAAAPVSVVFSNAGTLKSEVFGSTRVAANYTLTGTAASYSLG